MPRAAGDERAYRIAVVNQRGQVIEELPGFPSVTTVIGDADGTKTDILVRWSSNVTAEGVAELLRRGKITEGASAKTVQARLRAGKLTPIDVRDARAASGSAIHDWAERLVLDKCTYDDVMEGTPYEDRGYAEALIAWHEQYDALPIAVERTLVSVKHRYAGTVDLIDQTPAGLVRVIDYKTSKRIYETHYIQGDAYALAWDEMNETRGEQPRVDQIVVVRFGADGTYEQQERPPTGARIFLRMLDLYNERERG